MSKFEVGQRVRAWFTAGPGEKCNITKVLSPVCLELLDHEGKHAYAHPRQCVRLVRKKPCPPQGKRLEHWMVQYPAGGSMTHTKGPNKEELARRDAKNTGGRLIHLVELKPGEQIITREALAKAWDATDLIPALLAENSPAFRDLCKALGLEAT